MNKKHQKSIEWRFNLGSDPEDLWPYLSDMNRLFKSLGTIPIFPTTISRSIPKGFQELTHYHLKSLAVWQEEPIMWEKPHRFGIHRHYRSGIFKELKILADLSGSSDKTRLILKIQYSTASQLLLLPISAPR